MSSPPMCDQLQYPSRAQPRAPLRYQPFYCEENIWWLCAEPPPGVGMEQVIFVASRHGVCPIAEQRAGGADGIAWWDYHCIGLDRSRRIWDLDSLLPMPVAASIWLDRSFPLAATRPLLLQPRFRVVPVDLYLEDFSSDRRHMRSASGGWLQPPPPWPCIGSGPNANGRPTRDAGSNLSIYRDLRNCDGPGILLDLAEFKDFSD